MRKDARAASPNDPGLQDSAHDGTGATVHDSRNADSERIDQLTRVYHLEPRAYAPRLRARPAMPPSQANAESLEDRLPLFLERGRQEIEHGARLARGEPEPWDESGLSTDEAYPSPRSPDSEALEAPIGLSSRSIFPAFVVRAGAMTLVAAAVAATLVFRQDAFRVMALVTADAKLPSSWMTGLPSSWMTASSSKNADQASLTPFGSRFQGRELKEVEPSSRPVPKLVANQEPPRGAGELFPLGVSVHDASNGVTLVIGGLASGATLSAGRTAGDNTWRLAASDLNNVMIQPPPNFAGAMDLTLELRMADETVSDRRSLRFEWAAPAVAELTTPAAIHYLDPSEIASLLKRGDDLIASGDFAAARLVLRRAADAGDAHAAMTLAETYDPVILEKLGVHGFVPDVAMARGWYEKAKKFGSAEAPQRLEMLASKRQ
jgi:hypothetical protein